MGVDGWYAGPALDHYHCHLVHCTKTNRLRISDTVKFFPTEEFPVEDQAKAILSAAADLTKALHHPLPTIPLEAFGAKQTQALNNLAGIFALFTLLQSPAT